MTTDRLQIYCDGSCPKPYQVGGWAFIILDTEYIVRSGSYEVATNQTMELCAALEALREIARLKYRQRPITIISDSQYLVKGMMQWGKVWRSKDYQGISNTEWWKLLHRHQDHCADLEFRWVKGHGSSKMNNHVDQLAGEAQKRGAAELARSQYAENS